jgi:Tfp pilus assembly protein PilX
MNGDRFAWNDGGLRSTRAPRRGAVLVAALVCVLVVTGIVGGMLQGALRARRQLHAERDLSQTELLLAAGVARAAARLADEPEYDGETWQLASEEIIGRGAGVVTIQAALAENAESWLVTIVAEYPAGSEISIRRTRSLAIQP